MNDGNQHTFYGVISLTELNFFGVKLVIKIKTLIITDRIKLIS
jgi:hypothetical protein